MSVESRIEEKVEKLYKRFIGPNSIGMSKNLETSIKKALRISCIQLSKRQERAIVEAGRVGLQKVCERNMSAILSAPSGMDDRSYSQGWCDAHRNMKSVTDLPDHFRSEIWGKSLVETLEV